MDMSLDDKIKDFLQDISSDDGLPENCEVCDYKEGCRINPSCCDLKIWGDLAHNLLIEIRDGLPSNLR